MVKKIIHTTRSPSSGAALFLPLLTDNGPPTVCGKHWLCESAYSYTSPPKPFVGLYTVTVLLAGRLGARQYYGHRPL